MKFTAWLLYKSSSSVFLYFLNELRHPAGQGTRRGVRMEHARRHAERPVPLCRTRCPVRTVEAALSLAISSLQRARPQEAVSGALGAGRGGKVGGILRRADAWRCEAEGAG